MILHDLRCTACERETHDVAVCDGVFPRCRCGGRQTWIPRRVATDLQPAFFCEATWQHHTRHRDAELAMAKISRRWSERTGIRWEPHAAGDKLGGARNESFARGKAFGYSGQGLRRSRGEGSEGGPSGLESRKTVARPKSDARRVTRDEFMAQRRDPVWRGAVRRGNQNQA